MRGDDQSSGQAWQDGHDAVDAAMQDQLDDLAAAFTAQQATLDRLLQRVRALEQRLGLPSG